MSHVEAASPGTATTAPSTTAPSSPANSSDAGTLLDGSARARPDGTDDRADAAAQIDLLRGQIDSLDEAIVRLVAERARLSTRVQRARMNAGGTRVELGRERVIRNAYRTTLGPEGPSLADAVLLVCRGRR